MSKVNCEKCNKVFEFNNSDGYEIDDKDCPLTKKTLLNEIEAMAKIDRDKNKEIEKFKKQLDMTINFLRFYKNIGSEMFFTINNKFTNLSDEINDLLKQIKELEEEE